MERDRYGYAAGYGWHPVAAEHNDALCAWNQGGHSSSERDGGRLDQAEEAMRLLRRRMEDRLRKDRQFVYAVAAIFEESYVEKSAGICTSCGEQGVDIQTWLPGSPKSQTTNTFYCPACGHK